MSSARSIILSALLVYLGSLAATLSLAQQPAAGSNSKPEEQVLRVERDWLAADAKGDAASLRRIIADDFIGTSFDGSLLDKDSIVPEGGGPGGFAGATPGETNVRVFGDTGVLMGVINTAGAGKIRVVLVCQKRERGWQIVAAQLTH